VTMTMILPLLEQLCSKRIVLASGSPRRKEILEGVGLKFEVIPSTFEEDLEPSMFPSLKEFVLETCLQKGLEVAERIRKSGQDPDLVIAADTIVALDGVVYGKPGTPDKAHDMLKKLSGKTHEVLTGVTLIWKGYHSSERAVVDDNFLDKFCEVTKVHMAPLTDDIISSYVETREPLDKAGGYGIQGKGGSLIEGIDGDYYNVVGFPLHRFCKLVNVHCSNSKDH